MSDTLAAVLRADIDWSALPQEAPLLAAPPSAPLPRPRSKPSPARHRRSPDRDRRDRRRCTGGDRRRGHSSSPTRRRTRRNRRSTCHRAPRPSGGSPGGRPPGRPPRLPGDRVLDLGRQPQATLTLAVRWPAARLRRRSEALRPRPGRPGAARDPGRSRGSRGRLVARRRRAGGRDRRAAMARPDRRGRSADRSASCQSRPVFLARRQSQEPGCGTTRSCSPRGAAGSTRSRRGAGDRRSRFRLIPRSRSIFTSSRPCRTASPLLLGVHRLNSPSDLAGTFSIELDRKGRRTAVVLGKEFGEMAPVGYSQGRLLTIPVRRDRSSRCGRSRSTRSSGGSLASRRSSFRGPNTPWPPPMEPWPTSRSATTPRSSSGWTEREPSSVRSASLGPGSAARRFRPTGRDSPLVIDSVELWVHDLGRDTLTRLVREAAQIEDPQRSPDGRLLYYTVGDASRFRRIRADPGAEPETVFEDAYRSFLAPDGRGALIRVGGFCQTESRGSDLGPVR